MLSLAKRVASGWPAFCKPIPRRTLTTTARAVIGSHSQNVEYDEAKGEICLDFNGEIRSLNTSWLRHNCIGLKDPHSGQWLGDVALIQPPCRAKDISINDQGLLKISWEADGHVSEFHLDWLFDQTQPLKKIPPAPVRYGMKSPKSLNYSDVVNTKKGLWEWLDMLRTDGMCLLKGAGHESGRVIDLANLVSKPQVTLYGETFDIVSTSNPINIAYTNVELKLHQDLAYFESPPGLQLLHCVEFESCVTGGESTLLDCAPLLEEFRQSHPNHFATLCKIPTRFQKIHHDRDDPVSIVYHTPIITLNQSHEIIRFTWAPQFEGPLPTSYSSDVISEYYTAYCTLANLINTSDDKLEFRLEKGDIITFNNRRVVHGRNSFSGEGDSEFSRHLQGVYVNIDEFRSKHRMLSEEFGTADVSTYAHTFNSDHVN